MPANFVPPSGVEYLRFLPEMILVGVATLVMVLEPLTPAWRKRALGYLALLGFAAAMVPAVAARWQPGPAFGGMLQVDGFATFFRVLVIAAGMLVTLVSFNYLRREGAEGGEYYALLLYSVAGQSIMVSASELIVLFIGLEISSISSYVLVGYLRREKLGNEAAAKYFLLGSFATAFLLYGIALIYGATGTTHLNGIAEVLVESTYGAGGHADRNGRGADAGGVRIQGFRGAVPGVGARCVSGGAGAGHRVSGGGAESRGVRRAFARLHDGVRADGGPMGSGVVERIAAHDDRRQLRRAHADKYQAAAGL